MRPGYCKLSHLRFGSPGYELFGARDGFGYRDDLAFWDGAKPKPVVAAPEARGVDAGKSLAPVASGSFSNRGGYERGHTVEAICTSASPRSHIRSEDVKYMH
jgi:hypothetical protein